MSIYIIFIKLIGDPTITCHLICYMIHDNTIKTCFIVLKQVELSAGLKWAVMTLSCPFSLSGNTYTIQSRRPKTKKNFENPTDINSTKILKQLLSLLNNILTL